MTEWERDYGPIADADIEHDPAEFLTQLHRVMVYKGWPVAQELIKRRDEQLRESARSL